MQETHLERQKQEGTGNAAHRGEEGQYECYERGDEYISFDS